MTFMRKDYLNLHGKTIKKSLTQLQDLSYQEANMRCKESSFSDPSLLKIQATFNLKTQG